jgi:hypothetical protein
MLRSAASLLRDGIVLRSRQGLLRNRGKLLREVMASRPN